MAYLLTGREGSGPTFLNILGCRGFRTKKKPSSLPGFVSLT